MPRLVLTGPAFAELTAKILGQGSAVRFRAHGRSMWPLIRDGDILTVEPVKMETLRVGDVVLHRTEPCGLVAHRLVARGVENGNLVLTTCGDVSPRVRDRVSAEQLLGRVVALERGKKAVRLDRGPWRLAGVLWAVLSPFGALLIQWVRRARRVVFRRPRCTRTAENGAAVPRGTDDRESVESAPASRSREEASDALISLCGAFAFGSEWPVPGGFSAGDWEQLVELAKRHGLTPLLFRSIADVGDCRIPAALHARLKRHYVVQTARNIRALRQLEEIGEALRDKGPSVIVLKGASSLLRLYEDVGCRTMVDIDLMVRRESAGELHGIMKHLGYRCPLAGSSLELLSITTEAGHRFPFERPGSLPVDVHIDILDRRDSQGLATREMWARARPIAPDGALRSLAPSHFLLHTASHYMKHWDFDAPGLAWVVDALLAARKWGGEIDWPEFWQAAERWEIGGDAATLMATLSHHWGLRVPLLPSRATPLPVRTLVSTAPDETGRRAAAIPLGYLRRLLKVRGLPTTRARLRYLCFLFFPPPENLRQRYSIPQGKLVAPYYVHHLVTRAARFVGGLAAWAWLCGRRRATNV